MLERTRPEQLSWPFNTRRRFGATSWDTSCPDRLPRQADLASGSARPISQRFRCCSPTARSHVASWTARQNRRLHAQAVSRSRNDRRTADAGRRNSRARGELRRTCRRRCRPTGRRARSSRARIGADTSRRTRASIWLSDMRGFTTLSETAATQTWSTSESVFDAESRQSHDGGEVLKFIGDGSRQSSDDQLTMTLARSAAAHCPVRAKSLAVDCSLVRRASIEDEHAFDLVWRFRSATSTYGNYRSRRPPRFHLLIGLAR